jgi:Mg2+ and Co2+ transporter CorA
MFYVPFAIIIITLCVNFFLNRSYAKESQKDIVTALNSISYHLETLTFRCGSNQNKLDALHKDIQKILINGANESMSALTGIQTLRNEIQGTQALLISLEARLAK